MRFLKRTFFFILLSFCFGVDTTFFLLYRGKCRIGGGDFWVWRRLEMWRGFRIFALGLKCGFLYLELLITILLYGDIFKS